MAQQWIFAVDPGREKCGIALIHGQQLILREVVDRQRIIERIKELNLPNNCIYVIGDRTGSRQFINELKRNFSHIHEHIALVDEHLSSVEARTRYWVENPPRGWRRLLPVSMQEPPVPIDDYVAQILAERYLSTK